MPPPSYWDEHAASKSSRAGGRMPLTLDGLLRWFLAGWREETPPAIHGREGWSAEDGEIERGAKYDHERIIDQGGSGIGTHRHAGEFKGYIQSRDHAALDDDGYFVWPMHRALAELRRREPIMARVVFALGMSNGDWRALARRGRWPEMGNEAPDMPVPEYMAERYFRDCLIHLWNAYADRDVKGLR